MARALPLIVLLLYFWIAGALWDFYLWCFHFTSTVYAPREIHSPGHFLQHFIGLLKYAYAGELYYFFISSVGLSVVFVKELWQLKQQRTNRFLDRSCDHGLWLSPLLYFSFCVVDLQGAADLIPLLPFVAIFFAVLVVFGSDQAARRIRTKLSDSRLRWIGICCSDCARLSYQHMIRRMSS